MLGHFDQRSWSGDAGVVGEPAVWPAGVADEHRVGVPTRGEQGDEVGQRAGAGPAAQAADGEQPTAPGLRLADAPTIHLEPLVL